MQIIFFYRQVTRVSPNLTKFKGYVMKLGLKRKKLYGNTEKSCLLFKAKGEIHCKYQTNILIMSDLCINVNSGLVQYPNFSWNQTMVLDAWTGSSTV